MYAVIRTGGKQYKVAENDVIQVEKLPGEAGESVELGEVLMVGDDKSVTTGTPLIESASVTATVLEQIKGDKVIIFKKKRRHNYRRKKGHRQQLTVLRVTDIATDGKPAKAKPKKAEATEAAKAPAAKPKTEAKPKAEAKPAKAKPEAAKAAEAAGSPPPTLSAPEGRADDLKKIGGVGPKLEEKLNGLGIYHYRQIAALTPEHVAWVDDQLSFHGRIERDNWIEQATTLAAEQKED